MKQAKAHYEKKRQKKKWNRMNRRMEKLYATRISEADEDTLKEEEEEVKKE